MSRHGTRRNFALRVNLLESRTMLSGDMGMWPLANPTPENTVLVRFLAGTPIAVRQTAAENLHATFGQSSPDGPIQFTLGSGIAPSAAVAQLQANPYVVYAEENSRIEATATITPTDPSYSSEWGLNQSNDVDIDAPQAWAITTGTSATTVAVTDTGIDYTHPDLYLNVALNQGEIPATIKSSLVDTNGDGRLDFYDLNSLDANRNVVLNGSGVGINA